MRPTPGRSTDITLPQSIGAQLLCPLTERGPKVAHTSLSSVAVKNTWSIISTPSNMLSWCGTHSPGVPRIVLPLTACAGCLISSLTLRREHSAPSQSQVLNIASTCIAFLRSRLVLYSVDNKSTAKLWAALITHNTTGNNTETRRLTTGIRSEKCVVRRFRRCANVYLHKPR